MKKLHLNKEVIVNLDNAATAQVKGGQMEASSDTITMMPTTLHTDLCTVMETPEIRTQQTA